MERDVARTAPGTCFLPIEGGSIFGACAAIADSDKIAHDGIRYQQHGARAPVRHSSRGHGDLPRTDPRFVRARPSLISTHEQFKDEVLPVGVWHGSHTGSPDRAKVGGEEPGGQTPRQAFAASTERSER
jgi:hypothetical protein